MQPPSIPTGSPMVAPLQSRPQKDPALGLPKKPSMRELPGERPFPEMDRTTPRSPQMPTRPGQR